MHPVVSRFEFPMRSEKRKFLHGTDRLNHAETTAVTALTVTAAEQTRRM